jgi:hypothetical protein
MTDFISLQNIQTVAVTRVLLEENNLSLFAIGNLEYVQLTLSSYDPKVKVALRIRRARRAVT